MMASLLSAGAAYAIRRGLTLEEVADAARLQQHDLIAAPERVPEDAISRILLLLQERFPDQPVALEMVETAPVHFLGPIEPVARLVPDLRAGIETFVWFQRVISTSFVLEYAEEVPGPMLRFEHPNDEEFGPIGAEMGLAMGVRAITEVLGLPHAIRGVWLGHLPSAPLERYAESFGVPVSFEARCNALLLHSHRLDDPVDPDAGARLRVVRANLELVRQQLDLREEPAELRQIRDAAARNAARGSFDGASLASHMAMSERTLQRRTGDLGTSVRAVIDDVRLTMAREMLADPDLNTLQIALSLGYSTDSAFRRAFRRWTGLSPAEYRRSPSSARSG